MYKQMASAVVLSCACATAMADYGLQPNAALAPEAASAIAMAVGDVTGDGRDDVVALTVSTQPFYRNRVILYAQTANGFAAPRGIDYVPDTTSYDVRGTSIGLADLDGDGDLDIVVSYGSYLAASLAVLTNNGTAFPVTRFATQAPLRSMAFVDFDNDGHLDLVAPNDYDGIATYHGDGAGSFDAVTPLPSTGFTSAVQLVDMDGDGRKDLVYKTWEDVLVRRNEGTGFSFVPRLLLKLGSGGFYSKYAAADFDGDRRADLMVSLDSFPQSTFLLYPQSREGTFRRKLPLATGPRAIQLVQAADLDGDGLQDLLTLDSAGSSNLGVRLSRGNGAFSPNSLYDAADAIDFALGDLNHDGIVDALVRARSGSLSYLLGRTTASGPDLAIFLGLNAGAAVVRVENRGSDYGVGVYDFTLSIEPRLGTVFPGLIPNDCSAYTAGNGSLQATCRMPALAPGTHQERVFPISLNPSGQRDTLIGRARLQAPRPDLRADNDQATTIVRINGAIN